MLRTICAFFIFAIVAKGQDTKGTFVTDTSAMPISLFEEEPRVAEGNLLLGAPFDVLPRINAN